MPQDIWSASRCGTEYAICVDRNKSEIYIKAYSDRMNAGGWIDTDFLIENPKASNNEIICYILRHYLPELSDLAPARKTPMGKAFKGLLKRYFK